MNKYGHKWKNDVVLAQRLKTVSTQYTIPLPGDNQRSLNFGATYRDSNTVTSQSRTLELVANESELWHDWVRTVGLHALTGTFDVGKTLGRTGRYAGRRARQQHAGLCRGFADPQRG